MPCLGNPCTRPNEEYFIPSFDLQKEAEEWEGTTHVNMAMSTPASIGVREFETVVLDEMRLLHRVEVAVSCHQLQPLLKFANCCLAEDAAAMHCIQHHGLILNVRPWAMAQLGGRSWGGHVLQGVPLSRRRSCPCLEREIVERLIGRTYAPWTA